MPYISRQHFFSLRPRTVDVTVEGENYRLSALSSRAQVKWARAIESKDPDAQWILIAESLIEPRLPRSRIKAKAFGRLPFDLRFALFSLIEELNGWRPTASDEQAKRVLEKVAAGQLTPDAAFAYFRHVSRISPLDGVSTMTIQN